MTLTMAVSGTTISCGGDHKQRHAQLPAAAPVPAPVPALDCMDMTVSSFWLRCRYPVLCTETRHRPSTGGCGEPGPWPATECRSTSSAQEPPDCTRTGAYGRALADGYVMSATATGS